MQGSHILYNIGIRMDGFKNQILAHFIQILKFKKKNIDPLNPPIFISTPFHVHSRSITSNKFKSRSWCKILNLID